MAEWQRRGVRVGIWATRCIPAAAGRCWWNAIMPGSRGRCSNRIDIHLRVPAVPYADLAAEGSGEPSVSIRARVEAARARQRERFLGRPGLHANAHMSSRDVRRHCRQRGEIADILRRAVERLGLSARGCHRVLKLARTIADLAGAADIAPPHVREAIQYRSLDRSVVGT
jgi:magnesium chelatase family protein